jgi:diguanylate cyclase (GGDEF)-like protein/PAS domain S-box-containing protein
MLNDTDDGKKVRFTSLRKSLFFRFGVLVTGAVALFALGYVFLGVRPVVMRIADSHFAVAAEEVEASLNRIFSPAESLIGVASRWAVEPGFAVDRPKEFNRLFRPVLEQMRQITSVVAGTTDGQGWMLLKLPDGRWRNRMTDIPGHGKEQHFIEWRDGSPEKEYREVVDYDPRDRPWFRGAMTAAGENRVHWTEPYIFFTTRDPGITVSSRSELADGRSLVVGFDIMLLDISRATSAVKVGEHGYVLVLTPDRRVLGLPRSTAPVDDDRIRQNVLRPADALGSAPVNAGLGQWQSESRPAARILRFSAEGRPWLATFRPFHLGVKTFWVAVFAPEADFVPAWQPMVQALAIILFVVLGLTLLVARRQASRFSAPLEALAVASERIARLDFEAGPPIRTRLTEIDKLATTLDAMRTMLSNFRTTVETQAVSLKDQITTLSSTEAQLRESEAHLQETLVQQQAILDNALVGIAFVRKRTFIHFNRLFADQLGYSGDELAGRSTELMYDSRESFLTTGKLAYDIMNRGDNFVEDLWLRRKDGSRFWGRLSGRAITAGDPRAGSVWILADLTERKRAEERLEYLVNHDPLTDLPNRLLFNDRLGHAIRRAERKNEQLALLFIDLDRFKAVNDTMGHQVGDQLLCAVAGKLSGNLRPSDTLARLGGDEFIALLEGVEAPASVATLAGHLIEALSAPLEIGERQFHISGSIGISIFPADGDDPATLVRNADAAMYQAKLAGRNTYHFYSEEMTRKAIARLELENQLRHAIERGMLEIHFQPQVSLVDGSVSGAEALLRLRHPERGMLSPLEFIPLAEETGLIFQIGLWVLEHSCSEWVALEQQGFRLPRIAVNLSVKQLQRGNFLDSIDEVLARTGLPRGVLELEITESAFLETEGAFALMEALGERGVVLSVDDFGTGYSSLSYLKRLPFGKLKIDRSFVGDIGHNSDGEALVRTIISLAGTLGLEVVAEGVETRTQAEFLVKEGCFLAQGFLFARPMPADAFRDWLARLQGKAGSASSAHY